MADFFRTMLKATRLARRRRPISAALALHDAFTAQIAKPKRKASKPATQSRATGARTSRTARPQRPAPGTFLTDDYSCGEGRIDYRLYTPQGSSRRRMPLVVMLHGCSQSATDFAAGTDMNRLADELGVVVLYPQQSPKANMARCWNWHLPKNQERGHGEPAMIAALTRHAATLCRANPARIYIAGISAGAAAAAIIGAAYPDLFVAVGVHSGVARGNIHTLGAALAAMQGKSAGLLQDRLPRQLPTIVFHGDSDRVVHPSNAGGFLTNLERSRGGPLVAHTNSGRSPGGRDFTRKTYRASTGKVMLEDWTVHGSGHCWSGGSAAGSYTDPAGPEASREMLRFFLARRRGD